MRRTVLILALWSTLLVGCERAQPPVAPTKPTEVLVSTPIVKEITDYEDYTGRTESVSTVEIRARVTGYLDKVLFKDGADVKQGDLLFEIDPRTYLADLARTDANLVQAEAHAHRLNSDYQRAKALLPKQAISQEEVDKIFGDRGEADAAVGVAKATRDLANLNYNFTKVTSPVSGRTSRKMIDPGNLVKADDTLLTTIVTYDPMYAYFDVDERTLLRVRKLIREGKVESAREAKVPVKLGLADEDGFSFNGTINFVDNKIDPQTGTLRIRGIFENPKQVLTPGLFVRTRVRIGSPRQAMLISERAIGTDQGQKFVYVVNDANEVVYRKLEVGSLMDGLRVVDKGLTKDEHVIVNGLQRVRPGVKVDPKPAPQDKDVPPAK